ncbi:hypothetical protein FBU30_004138 [Linnemannia zychae]|nr:hypothetical protein FBU30_004138 [Linnemannia zychae]
MNTITNQLMNTHVHDASTTVVPGRTPRELAEADNLIRLLYDYAETKKKSAAKRGRNLVYGNVYELDLLNEKPPTKAVSTGATIDCAEKEVTTPTAKTTTSTTTAAEKKDKSHILEVTSWKMNEFEYASGNLPTLARGLFTYLDTTTSISTSKSSKNKKDPILVHNEESLPVLTGKDAVGSYRILLRGYNKFFNVGEVSKTSSEWIAENTEGPYEVTLKENGCIIFMSGLPPNLVGSEGGCVVTSKHSLGHVDPETGVQPEATHASKGREWLEKGLASRGKTMKEFGRWLWDHNLTAVAELCDDSFEEHILEYPIEKSGLYLHGLNRNTVEFQTLPSSEVQKFAMEWGLRRTEYVTCNTHQEVKKFTDEVRNAGEYDNRPVEGFVVRSKVKGDGTTHFFKIKYDEPYLMYREWREITKRLWSIEAKKIQDATKAKERRIAEEARAANKEHTTSNKAIAEPKEKAVEEFKIRMRYPLTKHYVEFVKDLIRTQPELFVGYNKNQGIISIRDMFLKHWESKTEQEQKKLISSAVKESGRPSTSSEHDFQRTVIIPIATIGCGKTTVSVALSKLFGWSHVSSDDFHHYRKTAGQQFMKAVVKALKDHTVVIADRNNHEFQHRRKLMETVKATYPKTRFVALYWSHEEVPLDTVRHLEIERVKNRGPNHQSMTPEFCPEYEFIIQRFLRTFEPLNPMIEPDSGFSNVIENTPGEESLVIVERVIKEFAIPTLGAGGVGNHAIPKPEEIKEAVQYALDWKPLRVVNGEAAKFYNEQQSKQAIKNDSSVSLTTDTTSSIGVKSDSSQSTSTITTATAPADTTVGHKKKARRAKEPNYFAIEIATGTVLNFLTEQFTARGLSEDSAKTTTSTTTKTADKALWTKLYEQFKEFQKTNRVGPRQHITLVHKSALKNPSPQRAQRANEIWKLYLNEFGLGVKTAESTATSSPATPSPVSTPPTVTSPKMTAGKVDNSPMMNTVNRNQQQQNSSKATEDSTPTSAVLPKPAVSSPEHQISELPSALESLSLSDNDQAATATVDYIVWTERIMILRVTRAVRTKSGKVLDNTQDQLHVTIGTAGDLVKPYESNIELKRWSRIQSKRASEEDIKSGPEIFAIKLERPLLLEGHLKPMHF